jgi:hypothetical protein
MTVPVITCGDPEGGCWCAVCQEPWRIRVPLLADGVLAAQLEVCPGCGATSSVASAHITGTDIPPGAAPDAEPSLRLPLPARLRAAIMAFTGRAEDLPGCALGGCRKAGSARHAYALPADDGTWTYYFHSARHREQWAGRNGYVI